MKEHLPDFLAQYGLNNWKEYLKHTIVPYVISLSGSRSTVLAKGGDYTVETIVGAPEVMANGGRLEVIPFLEGYSTSAIERRIKEGGL